MLLDRVLRRLFARRADYLHRARGYLKYCLIVVLLVALGTLSALAYAITPDTVGLPGIYDDADHDDVVSLLTDTVGARDLSAHVGRPPAPPPRSRVVSPRPRSS